MTRLITLTGLFLGMIALALFVIAPLFIAALNPIIQVLH